MAVQNPISIATPTAPTSGSSPCHSGAGSQLTSLRFGERLAAIGAAPSIGPVGDSFANALAKTVNGLHKTELVYGPARGGPWKTHDDLELAALGWAHWDNTSRLHSTSATCRPRSSKPRSKTPNGPTSTWSKSNSPSLH